MSAFRQDMLLYPDGAPRVMNVDNRFDLTINGVPCRVEVKGGGFTIVSYIDAAGGQHRMVQEQLNVLGIVLGALQVQSGRIGERPEVMGILARRRPDG